MRSGSRPLSSRIDDSWAGCMLAIVVVVAFLAVVTGVYLVAWWALYSCIAVMGFELAKAKALAAIILIVLSMIGGSK